MQDPVSGTATAVSARVLSEALKPLIAAASDAIKDRFLKWKNDAALIELSQRIGQVSKVKTLWNIDNEVSLYDFYYPSNVQFTTSITKRIGSLIDMGLRQN